MNTWNLLKWGLTVPAITTWIDLVTQSQIWETISNVTWATSQVLEVWNSLLNPLFSTITGWASAWLITNSVLKEFKWMEDRKKTRWLLSLAAWWAWIAWWSAAAPYILTGSIAYWAWKHWWNYWKEALKRTAWTAWWLTWWVLKWAVKWWFNSARAWIKWEQKLNPVV